MVDTTVSLATTDLANNFSGYINAGGNLVLLQNAVMAHLNAAPYQMGVTAVVASIEAQGKAVKFVLTSPVALDPPTVKNALR
jgi:hypothetical protein